MPRSVNGRLSSIASVLLDLDYYLAKIILRMALKFPALIL